MYEKNVVRSEEVAGVAGKLSGRMDTSSTTGQTPNTPLTIFANRLAECSDRINCQSENICNTTNRLIGHAEEPLPEPIKETPVNCEYSALDVAIGRLCGELVRLETEVARLSSET